jgi:hypothetical protein
MTALVAAFSLQDKIEQYGAYAGIAAVFGLGVLSLLYFAQAREVKRLRDWAGRAPERAAELEARVQADAQRRAAAQQAPQPARPAAPVTPAAQQQAPAPGVAAPATAAAAATGGAGPTTVTKPATATPQNGTGSGAAVPPPGTEAKPAEGDAKKEGDANGKQEGDAKPGEAEAKPAAPAAPATAAAAGAPAAPAADKPATPGQPEVKPPVPAAATAAAAGAAPRPQPAAPLRAPTPAASLPPRTPAGARPAAAGGGRSRGRLAAIVGGALGAVAVVVVVAVLLFSGGDKPTPKPNTVAQPGASGTPAGSSTTPSKAAVKLVRKDFPLAVLNGTTVTGLARGAADKLTRKGYNEPNVVTNDTTNQARDTTEIFFEAKARAAALDVAKILGVSSANVKPMDANARALADRATVAVFVGADKAQ